MTDGKKIPQWVFAIGATCVSSLVIVAGSLGTYIFTGLAKTVTELDDSTRRMGQEMRIISYKVDSFEKKIDAIEGRLTKGK